MGCVEGECLEGGLEGGLEKGLKVEGWFHPLSLQRLRGEA